MVEIKNLKNQCEVQQRENARLKDLLKESEERMNRLRKKTSSQIESSLNQLAERDKIIETLELQNDKQAAEMQRLRCEISEV